MAGREVSLEVAFEEVQRLLRRTRKSDGALWWVGNGGSAAICSHLSQDVVAKLHLRSFAFTDAALLTCMANDFGYSEVYAQPLREMARPGDMMIAISSSGNSPNILNSAALARDRRLQLVTLSGFSKENKLWQVPADVAFYLPSSLYGVVEVAHMTLLHGLIETMVLGEAPKIEPPGS